MNARVTIAALLLLVAGAAPNRTQAEVADAMTNVRWTLPIDPNSPSAMVSATHLVLFQLEAMQVRTTVPTRDGTRAREITARVVPEALYKGRLDDPIGTPVRLQLHQQLLCLSRV